MSTPEGNEDASGRALAWHHSRRATVCDVIEPWEHGTVLRASAHPNYWDFNVVRVEDDPETGAAELAGFADEALAGLPHRRVDFDLVEAGEKRRAAFAAMGWSIERLIFMLREVDPPPVTGLEVEEVPYDAVAGLRVTWHREDYPGIDPTDYHASAREIAMRTNARVLAVRNGGAPIAFAQLEQVGSSAEITSVYVHPEQRGSGLGTAITRAAMDAAGPVDDLWICADDEGRPKELYARLGFRTKLTVMECTRLPL